jgi:hypothetical protein
MSNAESSSTRITRRIRWIARIWGAVVLAVALFILAGYAWNEITPGVADPYAAEEYPPIENIPPLFALLSAIGLGIAWRWEGIGGAIAVLFNLAGLPVLLIHWPIAENFPRYLVAPYGVWMVITVPGVLFLASWWRTRTQTGSRPADSRST